MTAPTFVGMGAVVSLGSSSPQTIYNPAGTAENDELVLVVHGGGTTSAWTIPSGFTLDTALSITAGEDYENKTRVYRKFAGASEPASYTIQQDGSAYPIKASIFGFRGVNTTTPINASLWSSLQTAGATTIAAPTITTTVADCYYVMLAFERTVKDAGLAVAGGLTSLGGINYPGAIYLLGGETIASAGAVSGRTMTASGAQIASSAFFALSFALAPAAGGGDSAAPTLSSATGASTGSTTATGGATTNEANGTLYTVWTTNSTTPTDVQVEAGQSSSGSAAAAAANSSVSSTGAKTNNATGLTASTTYYAHSMHKDAAGNRSNVVTSASFTTSAGAPVLSIPTGTATGSTTATVGATTTVANGTLYAVVSTSATQPSVAQIKAGQNHTGAAAAWAGSQTVSSTGAKTLNATGLTASTAYYAHLVHADAAANDSNRVVSSSFTTSAPATATLTIAVVNNTNTSLTSTTIPHVTVQKLSDRTQTLSLASQATNGSGNLIITSASLAAGTDYIVTGWNADGTSAFIVKATAA